MDQPVKALSAPSTAPDDDATVNFPQAHALYQRICATTKNSTKLMLLKNLWTILLRQAAIKSTDFRATTIGIQTKELGGPTPQTLRNRNGADYRAIIAKFADEAGGVTKGTARLTDDPHDHLLAAIPDRHTRNHVRMLIQENRSLRNQVNLLKNQISQSAPPIPSAPTAGETLTAPDAGDGANGIGWSKGRRRAVEAFIDEASFAAKKWTLNEHGAIVDPFEMEIAVPGFYDALKQALAFMPKR